MKEVWKDTKLSMERELLLPVSVKDFHDVDCCEELLNPKEAFVSFENGGTANFAGKGAYVVLDFGRELCGGVRIISRTIAEVYAQVRITFGESLTEACSDIGYKNATNHHAPRDFIANISNMSDLTFGQSGFRFARVEVVTETPVSIRNIYAVNTLPVFARQGTLKTDDERLNQIMDTAAYTLELSCQNGRVWDGIKRDRLTWSGDLNPELLTCLYLHGDNDNIPNALMDLRKSTPADMWINEIPSYSAWWVLNLCDYCRFTGNTDFYQQNRDYAAAIMKRINSFVADDGTIDFRLDPEQYMVFFLDWPSYRTPDAPIGTAALILYTANRMLELEDNEDCRQLHQKLQPWLKRNSTMKQVRAFQILAGRREPGDGEFLEKDGAKGMSTFMAYYILKADVLAGGTNQIAMIQDYFGGMLDRGATTFWEDFDLSWLEGSGRIDEIPAPGVKDLHADYGAYCYQGLRHSFCHGWASGVLAFLYEYLLGVQIYPGGKIDIVPQPMGIHWAEGAVPVPDGMLCVQVTDGKVIKKHIS